jgi:hypothetical protein
MSAGVHHSGNGGDVGALALLLDRKRVHVSAKGNGRPLPMFDFSYDSRTGNSCAYRKTEGLHFLSCHAGRSDFLIAQLRMAMEIPSDLHESGSEGACAVEEVLSSHGIV